MSLPLNRGRRLTGYVIHHAVNTTHLIDDARGHFTQQWMRQRCPVRCHEVRGLDRTQSDDIVIRAPVTHHADRLDRQEYREGLGGQVVPGQATGRIDGAAQFFNENRVGTAQQIGKFGLDLAQDAHTQAGTREGMAVDHAVGQTQRHAQLAHFVFEQFAQGFEQLEIKRVGQATHVMVRLDGDGLAGLGAGRFDDVGINGALSEPACVLELGGLGLEDLDELAADDLAFGFGIGHAGKLAHELNASVDMDDAHAHVLGKRFHDLLAFVQAQQAVVDKHAGEPVTNGLVDQGCRNRRIDAARQTKEDFFVAHLFANARDGFVNVIGHVPVALAAADFLDKTREHRLALHGMGDLRVELHGVELTGFVRHAGDRARVGRGHHLEALGQARHLIPVAHPDLEHAMAFGGHEVLDIFQKTGVATGTDLGIAKFTVVAIADLAAKLLGHGLHAVANTQHRHTQFKHQAGHLEGVFVIR